jgi:hypothetical protein
MAIELRPVLHRFLTSSLSFADSMSDKLLHNHVTMLKAPF